MHQVDNSGEGVQRSTRREVILEHKSTQVLCDKNIIKKRVIGDEIAFFSSNVLRRFERLRTRPELSPQEIPVVERAVQLNNFLLTRKLWSGRFI